jgi:hypothetical protein
MFLAVAREEPSASSFGGLNKWWQSGKCEYLPFSPVQNNQLYLPFHLPNASTTPFNCSKVMSERTVTSSALTAANEASSELFSSSPAAVKID